ncbi:ubiquinone/menaquinone biosynthesis methyltransferase [candidate division KSB1 bacterium]|nr:ubiquinone/menaquinone biosynthesis methyltransferase [candidate division KSB1 bacterium]RQW04193.1 MAG: ubiquinone/menaquinone biosynthesis methyltransferase [candidate division KSB1 bacterium]
MMSDTLQKKQTWKMFNRIAWRYDLLNRMLSFRRDVIWRKKCARLVPRNRALTVLDLATGTGDLLLEILKARPNIKMGIGIDPAMGMLSIARRKTSPSRAVLLQGDAQKMSFKTEAMDITTMAFGIRNISDVDMALREMYRVLVFGGKALILEFSLPNQTFIRKAYLLYFRYILPRLGGLISGDRAAYHYLNQTVENFPYGETFCRRMIDAGFVDVTGLPLTFGIVTLYSGTKREHD